MFEIDCICSQFKMFYKADYVENVIDSKTEILSHLKEGYIDQYLFNLYFCYKLENDERNLKKNSYFVKKLNFNFSNESNEIKFIQKKLEELRELYSITRKLDEENGKEIVSINQLKEIGIPEIRLKLSQILILYCKLKNILKDEIATELDKNYYVCDLAKISYQKDYSAEIIDYIWERIEKNSNIIQIKNSFQTFKNLDKLKKNFNNLKLFPTDYEHCLLNAHSHLVDFDETSDNKRLELAKSITRKIEEFEWTILNKFNTNGYKSVLYINNKKRSLILAFQGLRFINFIDQNFQNNNPEIKDITNDYDENNIKNNLDDVFDASLSNKQNSGIDYNQERLHYGTKFSVQMSLSKGYSLSFTGSVFGAWLAEEAVYYSSKFLECNSTKAVTFDGMGSLDHWKVMGGKKFKTVDLEIVSYFSAPNFFNCFNEHVTLSNDFKKCKAYRLITVQDNKKKDFDLILVTKKIFEIFKSTINSFELEDNIIEISKFVQTNCKIYSKILMKINELNVINNGFIIITNDLMNKIEQFIKDEKVFFKEKNQEKIKECIWSDTFLEDGFIIITNDLMNKIEQFIKDEKVFFKIWSDTFLEDILKYIFKRQDDDEDDKEICVKTLKYIDTVFQKVLSELDNINFEAMLFQKSKESIFHVLKMNLCKLNTDSYNKYFTEKDKKDYENKFKTRIDQSGTLSSKFLKTILTKNNENDRFFLDSLIMLFTDSSQTILKAFDHKSGKPHHYKQVKKWPIITFDMPIEKENYLAKKFAKKASKAIDLVVDIAACKGALVPGFDTIKEHLGQFNSWWIEIAFDTLSNKFMNGVPAFFNFFFELSKSDKIDIKKFQNYSFERDEYTDISYKSEMNNKNLTFDGNYETCESSDQFKKNLSEEIDAIEQGLINLSNYPISEQKELDKMIISEHLKSLKESFKIVNQNVLTIESKNTEIQLIKERFSLFCMIFKDEADKINKKGDYTKDSVAESSKFINANTNKEFDSKNDQLNPDNKDKSSKKLDPINQEIIISAGNDTKKQLMLHQNTQTEDDNIIIPPKESENEPKNVPKNKVKLKFPVFINRDDYKKKLKNLLKSQQYCNIYGESGCGKTTLVRELCNEITNDQNLIIKWFDGKSLLNEMIKYADELKIYLNDTPPNMATSSKSGLLNGDQPDLEELFRRIKKKLNKKTELEKEYLFIIDDLITDQNDFMNDFSEYLMNGFNPNINFLLITKEKFKSGLELKNFSIDSYFKYCEKVLVENNRLTKEDLTEIFNEMKNNERVSPNDLIKLFSRINNKEVSCNLKEIKEHLNKEQHKLFIKSEAYDLLCYLAYLEGSNVSKNLLENLTKKNLTKAELKENLQYLENIAEIKLKKNNFNQVDQVIILERVQKKIQKMCKIDNKEKQIVKKIINTLNDLIKNEEINDETTGMSKCLNEYFNHAINILKFQSDDKSYAELCDNIGEIYCKKLFKYKAALYFHEESLKINKYKTAHHFYKIGYVYKKQGENEKALSHFQEAIRLKSELSILVLANILEYMASIYGDLGKYGDAIKYYNKSIEKYKEEKQNTDSIKIYNKIGTIFYLQNNFEKAIKYYEAAISDFKSPEYTKKSDQLNIANIYNNIGLAQQKEKKYEDALVNLEESLRIYRQIFKTDELPAIAIIQDNLGNCMEYLKRNNDEILGYYEYSLEIKINILFLDHFSVKETRRNIERILNNKEKNNEPSVIENKKPRQKPNKVSEGTENNMYDDLDDAKRLNHEGNLLDFQGKIDDALSKYEKAVNLLEKLKSRIDNLEEKIKINSQKDVLENKIQMSIAASLNNIGLVKYKQNKCLEALDYYRQSLEIKSKIYNNKNHPSIALTRENIELTERKLAKSPNSFQKQKILSGRKNKK
jgi:Tfp pilus assembly protein PilF